MAVLGSGATQIHRLRQECPGPSLPSLGKTPCIAICKNHVRLRPPQATCATSLNKGDKYGLSDCKPTPLLISRTSKSQTLEPHLFLINHGDFSHLQVCFSCVPGQGPSVLRGICAGMTSPFRNLHSPGNSGKASLILSCCQRI